MSPLDRATSFSHAGRWPREEASDSVTLDFDRRHRRRLRLATDSGAELPQATAKTAAIETKMRATGVMGLRPLEWP